MCHELTIGKKPHAKCGYKQVVHFALFIVTTAMPEEVASIKVGYAV